MKVPREINWFDFLFPRKYYYFLHTVFAGTAKVYLIADKVMVIEVELSLVNYNINPAFINPFTPGHQEFSDVIF